MNERLAEELEVEVKDHLKGPKEDECGYCGQVFPPDEVVIEKEILGMKWRFCSEECYQDFKDAADFKDQDLDSKDEVAPSTEDLYDQYQDEKEDI